MQDSPVTVAYSPCPNDTFIFCQLAQQPDVETHLHDVETLNRSAFDGEYDVTKLSFHAWLLVQDEYELLNVGAALGRGCGPLVITKGGELNADSVVAVPGEYTTAHLLLRLWNPEFRNRIFMPFDQIMDAVESGQADAGVIIHEGRFTYKDRGFECLADLGEWWESTTGQPIPLGCIAVRKSLGSAFIARFEQRLKESIQAAFDDSASTTDYVKEHAQELADEVTSEHIKTYVNDFTLNLGEEGRAAIAKLQQMAKTAGIFCRNE
ncbi:1,4-dihydroxy-6-naphthoate synthase [Pontiella sulfatireligans]|uniref:1,4-dihydroxy-6-naphtoate synthase n=1 Tax=Pontiella sulfatireligans TaxID=2750658 RepID=A0A6C2UIB6_9BACT|nr:1,4-dihydroxy-6-naphthoate synthase [Pontiella sulfatireligans]VGO19699.1 1,4-dihydroxy-6-naphtoate synthase [Pontiella sulfatireligans]